MFQGEGKKSSLYSRDGPLSNTFYSREKERRTGFCGSAEELCSRETITVASQRHGQTEREGEKVVEVTLTRRPNEDGWVKQ